MIFLVHPYIQYSLIEIMFSLSDPTFTEYLSCLTKISSTSVIFVIIKMQINKVILYSKQQKLAKALVINLK